MAKTIYHTSPIGTLSYPHLDRPDTAFNKSEFKTGLILEGAEAIALKDQIKEAADAALLAYWDTEEGEKVKVSARKEWKPFYPFDIEEDNAGNPTGYIKFDFKQNSAIRLKDGTVKQVSIGVKDSNNKAITRPVWNGSEGRVMFSMRAIAIVAGMKAGVRCDLAQVQVTKMADRAGPRFGKVEGGYTDDDDGGTQSQGPAESATDKDTGGEY